MGAYGRRLVGYAFLKAEMDAGSKDLRNILSPLVARAVANMKGVLSPNDIADEVKNVWGMEIPVNVIRYILPTLADKGLIARNGNAFTVAISPADKLRLKGEETSAGELVKRVIASINHILMREIGPDKYDPEQMLYAFLDDHGLGMFTDGTRPKHFDSRENNVVTSVISTYLGYDPVTNSFTNSQAVSDLSELVSGDMLFRAASSISEADTSDVSSMGGVSVFFDTGLLLRLLGHLGDDLRLPVFELVELATKTGCKLCAFRHCVEELQEVLRQVSTKLHAGSDGWGRVYENALRPC